MYLHPYYNVCDIYQGMKISFSRNYIYLHLTNLNYQLILILHDHISLNSAKNCPTLFQKIIDKAFDVRTIYMDGKVLFFKLKSDNLDIRKDAMKAVEYSIIDAPKKMEIKLYDK